MNEADSNGYTAFSMPYSFVTIGGTTEALNDESVSAAIPIGFTFTFGQTYTEVVISVNGFISFDLGAEASCCGAGIPHINAPNAIIALAVVDFFPNTVVPSVGTVPEPAESPVRRHLQQRGLVLHGLADRDGEELSSMKTNFISINVTH